MQILEADKWGFTDTVKIGVALDKAEEDVAPKSEEGAECPTCHGTGRIGTTDWLTKNISKKQLAEEKAKAIAEHEQHIKSEVAREIFEEIYEECFDQYGHIDYEALAELKKKYTEN
jgi:RecJ-like exonuclease